MKNVFSGNFLFLDFFAVLVKKKSSESSKKKEKTTKKHKLKRSRKSRDNLAAINPFLLQAVPTPLEGTKKRVDRALKRLFLAARVCKERIMYTANLNNIFFKEDVVMMHTLH